ncbi:Uncharacterized protein SCF082_LOCUS45564, partial [Durusdinium trenchii]
MLRTLDNVDWKSLEHAYGSAEDVPDLIRQLLSQDAKVRSDVMWHLYGNVFHQGTRYPATPYVIPFLIELCSNPDILDRGEILRFWGSLITGYFSVQERPTWGDGTHIYFCGEIQEGDDDDPYSEALHQIYRNSLSAKELLFRLLTDEEVSVRAGAAWVLACLPTLGDPLIDRLRSQLRREANGWVRAAIAFSLGEIGDSDSLRQILGSDTEHPAARCMAACELARISPRDELIEPLLGFICEPIAGYDNVPGAGGESTGDAAFSITYLPPEVRQHAVPAICERLEHARSFATMPLVAALLSAAFEQREEPLTRFNELQRLVLLAMLNAQELWSIGNLHWTFQSYGLPHDREECAQLLGVQVTKDEAFSELSIAVTYSDMGFLEKARQGIEKALELDPTVFARIPKPDECWLFCAKAFAETDPERAVKTYDNARSINPNIGDR